MKRIKYVHGGFTASEISLGCMRMGGLSVTEADRVIQTAIDEGIDFFDHADIYGGGSAEEKFAEALSAYPGARVKIILQSKCGIRNGQYDFFQGAYSLLRGGYSETPQDGLPGCASITPPGHTHGARGGRGGF